MNKEIKFMFHNLSWAATSRQTKVAMKNVRVAMLKIRMFGIYHLRGLFRKRISVLASYLLFL